MKKAVKFILNKLENDGHQAYIVGGAVRDILLNLEPSDYDITTSCIPDRVKELFKEYDMYLSGLKHGTVSIVIDKEVYEITTFRKDGNYIDYRHPDKVYFSTNVLDDIARRDFTINALLIDYSGKLYDPYNYKKDLDNKIIKAIGDANQRFKEDALRIMRAIRFCAELNFKIDINTKKAIFHNKDLLHNISNERKANEFIKIIKSNNLNVLNEYKTILETFINYDFSISLFSTNNFIIRLAILFNNYSNELDKLFLNKKITNTIKNYIRYSDYDNLTFALSNIDNIDEFMDFIFIYKNIDIKNEYLRIKDYIVNNNTLAITSKELMSLGFKDKALGDIKKRLIYKIRNHDFKNKYEEIMTYLKEVL